MGNVSTQKLAQMILGKVWKRKGQDYLQTWVWRFCSNKEVWNRAGGARGEEGHGTRGSSCSSGPQWPLQSSGVHQAMGFWERDWSRLVNTTWFKNRQTNKKRKDILIVQQKANQYFGRSCALPTAERQHIHNVWLQHPKFMEFICLNLT